jgi:hypothetical protein
MKISIKSLILAISLILTLPCTADQAAYIDRADALAAEALLGHAHSIKSFCAPCGDSGAILMQIETLDVAYTNYETYWEVRVNGMGIDLAYTYFLVQNRWKNVAIELGLEVSDVPEFID